MFGIFKRLANLERSANEMRWDRVHENSFRINRLEEWYKQEHCEHEAPELITTYDRRHQIYHVKCKECGKVLVKDSDKSKEYMVEYYNEKTKEYKEKI